MSLTEDFIEAMAANPTVYHWVEYTSSFLKTRGFTYLSERSDWRDQVKRGGKYFTTRNGSSIIAFVVGSDFKVGSDGIGLVGCHIDANCFRLKPTSIKKPVEGVRQLGVASYGGPNTSTWWDRDLGLGGRLVVKNPDGSFASKVFQLDHPLARIPTLAPHFGKPAEGPFNPETQMTPIIGLISDDEPVPTEDEKSSPMFGHHDLKLLRAIAKSAGVPLSQIVQADMELFDDHKGTIGGIDEEFLFCGRLDDKLCSFAAIQALVDTADETPSDAINAVALFDVEEIGSLLRQGARGGLFQHSMARAFTALAPHKVDDDDKRRSFANSFFISSDVTHAVNPNFRSAYLEHHMPKLNTGMVVKLDPNMHTTSDAISTAFVEEIGRQSGNTVQYFHIRNDGRSGGTIGPSLSSATGIRAVDMGIPQLSMHSVRATTGSKDIDLGTSMFSAYFRMWTKVDAKFRAGDI